MPSQDALGLWGGPWSSVTGVPIQRGHLDAGAYEHEDSHLQVREEGLKQTSLPALRRNPSCQRLNLSLGDSEL